MRRYVAVMRIIHLAATAAITLTMAACGNNGDAGKDSSNASFGDAMAVASKAGFVSCVDDSSTIASDAVRCDSLDTGIDGTSGGATVNWFKSDTARDQWKTIADGVSIGVILYGSNWAIECNNKAQCDWLSKRIGGTEG